MHLGKSKSNFLLLNSLQKAKPLWSPIESHPSSIQVTGFSFTLSSVWSFFFMRFFFLSSCKKKSIEVITPLIRSYTVSYNSWRTTWLWSRYWNSTSVCFHLTHSKVPFYLSCVWLAWHKTSYSQYSSVFSAKYWRWGTVSRLGISVSILG